jgi:hypothetical protein
VCGEADQGRLIIQGAWGQGAWSIMHRELSSTLKAYSTQIAIKEKPGWAAAGFFFVIIPI